MQPHAARFESLHIDQAEGLPGKFVGCFAAMVYDGRRTLTAVELWTDDDAQFADQSRLKEAAVGDASALQ